MAPDNASDVAVRSTRLFVGWTSRVVRADAVARQALGLESLRGEQLTPGLRNTLQAIVAERAPKTPGVATLSGVCVLGEDGRSVALHVESEAPGEVARRFLATLRKTWSHPKRPEGWLAAVDAATFLQLLAYDMLAYDIDLSHPEPPVTSFHSKATPRGLLLAAQNLSADSAYHSWALDPVERLVAKEHRAMLDVHSLLGICCANAVQYGSDLRGRAEVAYYLCEKAKL